MLRWSISAATCAPPDETGAELALDWWTRAVASDNARWFGSLCEMVVVPAMASQLNAWFRDAVEREQNTVLGEFAPTVFTVEIRRDGEECAATIDVLTGGWVIV